MPSTMMRPTPTATPIGLFSDLSVRFTRASLLDGTDAATAAKGCNTLSQPILGTGGCRRIAGGNGPARAAAASSHGGDAKNRAHETFRRHVRLHSAPGRPLVDERVAATRTRRGRSTRAREGRGHLPFRCALPRRRRFRRAIRSRSATRVAGVVESVGARRHDASRGRSRMPALPRHLRRVPRLPRRPRAVLRDRADDRQGSRWRFRGIHPRARRETHTPLPDCDPVRAGRDPHVLLRDGVACAAQGARRAPAIRSPSSASAGSAFPRSSSRARSARPRSTPWTSIAAKLALAQAPSAPSRSMPGPRIRCRRSARRRTGAASTPRSSSSASRAPWNRPSRCSRRRAARRSPASRSERMSIAPYRDVLNREAEIIGVSDHLASEIPELMRVRPARRRSTSPAAVTPRRAARCGGDQRRAGRPRGVPRRRAHRHPPVIAEHPAFGGSRERRRGPGRARPHGRARSRRGSPARIRSSSP